MFRDKSERGAVVSLKEKYPCYRESHKEDGRPAVMRGADYVLTMYGC